jgi:hypothetical protein
MLVTWAKPLHQKRPRLIESYTRKIGRELCENRRDKVIAYLGAATVEAPSAPYPKSLLADYIPGIVAESLKHYVPRAMRALHLIEPYDVIVHCPVRRKNAERESTLILIEGKEYAVATLAEKTEDN